MAQARPDAFQALASGIYLEGLAVDAARNVVWFSDVIAGGVHGVTPDGKSVASLNAGRMWTGGVFMNADGAVLSSGQGGIMWNNPDTGKSGWLLDKIDGKPINGINEMTPDGAGGIYFGTVDIEMIILGQTPRPAAIYRLTVDGEVIPVAPTLGFVNGVMRSADGKRLFYNDTFDGTYVFDIRPDKTLSERRRLLEKPDCDGMGLDAEGNLWLTGFQSGHFERIRPDGSAVAPFQTPAKAITQIRFGGADLRDIYFTSVSDKGGETLKEGGQLTERDSVLYRGRSDVAGMAIAPSQFRLS